jgi:outer membrane protein TolC
MKLKSVAWAAVAAAWSMHTTVASAQSSLSENRIQELIRAAASRAGVQAQGTQPQPGGTTLNPEDDRPTLALTLDEAIKLALDRNLDIAVQRLNPQTFDFSLAGLRASYRPTLTSTVGQQSATNASTSTIAGTAGAVTNATTTWNGGFLQNLRWGGGNLALTLNNSRLSTDSPTTLFPTQYGPNWAAQYTQPLLRNFSTDQTRQQLVVTGLNQDISEIQLQASIINTISNVRNAYWDYVFAVQSVDVARRSVELAEQLVRDNQTRVEIGTMAPIDVVQAQSQAATQRQIQATAQGTRRTAELTLKRLIVAGTQDPNWNVELNPTDRPDFRPEVVDVGASVRRALESRTDLAQARKTLQINDSTLKFLHNQTLPQADVVARYQLAGQGGTRVIRDTSSVTSPIRDTIPGGYRDALNTLFNNDFPSWTIALNVSYPLGTSAQDANVARARVQVNQVEAQLRQIELQIATEVTNAATQVQNNVEVVQAAQAAREFAQRQLEAEQSKFEVGMSTNYFVVQAQRDLASAQNNELQAVLAYRRSLVELERLQQTTLQTSSITVLGQGAGAGTVVGGNSTNLGAGNTGGNILGTGNNNLGGR